MCVCVCGSLPILSLNLAIPRSPVLPLLRSLAAQAHAAAAAEVCVEYISFADIDPLIAVVRALRTTQRQAKGTRAARLTDYASRGRCQEKSQLWCVGSEWVALAVGAVRRCSRRTNRVGVTVAILCSPFFALLHSSPQAAAEALVKQTGCAVRTARKAKEAKSKHAAGVPCLSSCLLRRGSGE